MKISAVIPIYNGKQYLREAVQSVINQTLLPAELILVDDGSTDDSISAVADLTFPFAVVKIRQSNKGQSAARNRAVQEAQADVIAFLDQDDFWYPTHLEKLTAPLLADPDIGWTFSDLDEIDGKGRVICKNALDTYSNHKGPKNLANILGADMFILPSASVVKKAAFETVGKFDEQLSGYEDDDLFLRLFVGGFKSHFVSESLSGWRTHSNGSSHGNRMDTSRRIYARKLIASFPNEPKLSKWWVRDIIAPRFYMEAKNRYLNFLDQKDWIGCREAYEDACFYASQIRTKFSHRMQHMMMSNPAMCYRFRNLLLYFSPPRC